MQAVGMDLFAAGSNDYLMIVSCYPLVHRLITTTSLAVTRAVKKWFEYFGLPKSIRSDGGPRRSFQDVLQGQQHPPQDQQPVQPRVK